MTTSLAQFLENDYKCLPPHSPPHIGYATTEQELPIQDLIQCYAYQRIERETRKGYSMNWHKDHFLLRKFPDGYQFVPYDKDPDLIYSLIWYETVQCRGGEIIFYPDLKVEPTTNMFILFDSKHIHRVMSQLDGIRRFILYKFYVKPM